MVQSDPFLVEQPYSFTLNCDDKPTFFMLNLMVGSCTSQNLRVFYICCFLMFCRYELFVMSSGELFSFLAYLLSLNLKFIRAIVLN